MPILVEALISKGLSLLGNAVLTKGQDVIEEKLGVKLKENASPEELAQYKKLEFEHEEFLLEAGIRRVQQEIEAEKVAQENVTQRWIADSMSDSTLSKNIRPGTLAYLTIAITLMAVVPINVDPAWIDLLKASYMLVLGAYFVGRSVEKHKVLGEQK